MEREILLLLQALTVLEKIKESQRLAMKRKVPNPAI